MYRTLLFDLDGTLIDSAEGIFHSLGWAMASVGGPELLRSEVGHFLGTPVEEVLQERFGCDKATALLIRARFLTRYREEGLYDTVPVPGMVELTQRLKAEHFRLAVATCKPWAYCAPTLALCGFSDCFEVVSGSDHNGVPEEKSAVIREALRLMAVSPEAALMIGDRAVDVVGALVYGIPCVGVEFCGYAAPFELEQAGAIAVVHTPYELEHFLLEQAGSKAIGREKINFRTTCAEEAVPYGPIDACR